MKRLPKWKARCSGALFWGVVDFAVGERKNISLSLSLGSCQRSEGAANLIDKQKGRVVQASTADRGSLAILDLRFWASRAEVVQYVPSDHMADDTAELELELHENYSQEYCTCD
jgi:hypothetical protein